MRCGSCKNDRPETDFAWKNKARGKRQAKCKECSSVYNKSHYTATKDEWLRRTRVNTARYRKIIRDFVWQYLLDHPCECGEADPIVLEFDHQADKEFQISHAIHKGYSLKKVQQEVAKCMVRCANCHRRKTAKDGNWWADQLSRSGGMADTADLSPAAKA